ncbi:MAG: hypothetical protein HY565_05675 [Candidatus Kerfeldbacteria bacterium]|nr:hypothetical protein [Candidatus Kerfeldbacteria bacterium]
MLRQAWRDELDSHIMDCADELVKLGYEPDAALTEAKKQFGDPEQIAKQLAEVHPWLAAYADWIALILLLLGIIPLYLLHYFAASTVLGLVSDQLLLWWWAGGLILVTLLLVKWQLPIIPLTRRLGIVVALSLGWFIATCVTITLDLNNFETTIYNGLFGLSCLVVLLLFKKQFNLFYRQLFILVAVSLMIAFAWREEGLFEQQLFTQCLYLVDSDPTTAPSTLCHQVSPLSSYLWFIYALAALASAYLTHYVLRLWKNGTHLYRKVITTGLLVGLPIVSFNISGVNSTGTLDVVPWKVDIYTAYVDILGRRPEDKDYQFYGTTRSYQHMSEVRAVLYASTERREKIKLLYQEILLREPTPEELEQYTASKQTINQIQAELKAQ